MRNTFDKRSKAVLSGEGNMRYPVGWRWTLLVVTAGAGLLQSLTYVPAGLSSYLVSGSAFIIPTAAIVIGAVAASSETSWPRRLIVAAVAIALAWPLNKVLAPVVWAALGILGDDVAAVLCELSYVVIMLAAFVSAYSLRRVEAFVLWAVALLPMIMVLTRVASDLRSALSLVSFVGTLVFLTVVLWCVSIWLAMWVVRGLSMIPPLSNKRFEQASRVESE